MKKTIAILFFLMIGVMLFMPVHTSAAEKTGLYKDEAGRWAYYENGQWQKDYSGIYKSANNGKQFYIYKGIWRSSATKIVKNSRGYLIYVKAGLWQNTGEELVKNSKGQWAYIKDGYLKTSYTGFYTSAASGKTFYIEKGIWQSGMRAVKEDASGVYRYFSGGTLQKDYTGFVTCDDGQTYYIKNGIWNPAFTQLTQNSAGKWLYVKDGTWQKDFTGLYTSASNGTVFYIEKGVWDKSAYGLVPMDGKLIYIAAGKKNTSFSGRARRIASFADSNLEKKRTYIVKNGIADTELSGVTPEVDKKAAAVLDKIGWNLHAAYDWCAGMKYYRFDPMPENGTAWYANYGFDNNYGNCYVMAADFVAFARLLGIECYQQDGMVPSRLGGSTPHSWVEAYENGSQYVYDPNCTNETGRDAYRIWYGKPGTWRYQEHTTMTIGHR